MCVILHVYGTPSSTYPKEDVFGRIKTSSVNAGGERWDALADHSAGKA